MLGKLKLIIIGLTLVLPAASAGLARAQTMDCDANAVIFCGATTQAQLVQKAFGGDGHNSAASIQQALAQMGISLSEVNAATLTIGTVDKSGNVMVNGKTVATGAVSLGRQFIPGSTAAGPFWRRSTGVSFASPTLAAFVNMSGGTFRWAILESCGNPVVATPVAKPVVIQKVVVQKQVVVKTVVAPTPQPAALPQTGGQNPMALLGIVAICSALFVYARGRQRILSQLLGR